MNRKELIAKVKELEKRIEALETVPKQLVGKSPSVYAYTPGIPKYDYQVLFEPLDRAYDPIPDAQDILMMEERELRTSAPNSGG